MARDLPADYLAALTSATRRPMANVYVWRTDGVTELDVTADVVSIDVYLTEEHRAGQAIIVIANPLGKYDPIGGGDLADAFTEDNKLVVKLGYNGSTHTAFTGKIASARLRYQRGSSEVIEITALDMGKRYWSQEITSTLYEHYQALSIVEDLFETYGGMAADDIALAEYDYEIDQVQFIQEKLMDAGMMCLEPKMYRLYFDHDGTLSSKPTSAPNTTSWDYDGRFISWLAYDWADPTVNKVTVTGRALSPEEIKGDEELMAYWNQNLLRAGSWESITFWWDDLPAGADVTNIKAPCVYGQVRVEKVSGDDHDDGWWARVKGPLYFDGGVRFKFPPSSDNQLKARFYGVPSTWQTSRVQATAWDPALSAKYGDIIEEIDNALIQTADDAATLAEETLRIAKWYRYKPRVRVPCNLVHEPGDLITAYNPRTARTSNLYVRGLRHTYARGDNAATELDCLMGPVRTNRLYFRSFVSHVSGQPAAYEATDETDTEAVGASRLIALRMTDTKGPAQTNVTWTQPAHPAGDMDSWVRVWLSPPLFSAQTLAAGTIFTLAAAADANMADDPGFLEIRFFAYLWRPGVGYVATLSSASAADRAATWTATRPHGNQEQMWVVTCPALGADVAMQAGDRIAVEAWVHFHVDEAGGSAEGDYPLYWNGIDDTAGDGEVVSDVASYMDCSVVLEFDQCV